MYCAEKRRDGSWDCQLVLSVDGVKLMTNKFFLPLIFDLHTFNLKTLKNNSTLTIEEMSHI